MFQQDNISLSKEQKFDKIKEYWDNSFSNDELSLDLVKVGIATQATYNFMLFMNALLNK